VSYLFELLLAFLTGYPNRKWQLFLASLAGVSIAALMIAGFAHVARALLH
jgi:hypothetical protein